MVGLEWSREDRVYELKQTRQRLYSPQTRIRRHCVDA